MGRSGECWKGAGCTLGTDRFREARSGPFHAVSQSVLIWPISCSPPVCPVNFFLTLTSLPTPASLGHIFICPFFSFSLLGTEMSHIINSFQVYTAAYKTIFTREHQFDMCQKGWLCLWCRMVVRERFPARFPKLTHIAGHTEICFKAEVF